MLYATQTRRAIVLVLRAERRFIGAAHIHAALRRDHPRLALSTVYRTLDALCDLGIVTRRVTAEGGFAEYFYCGETPHHHAVCHTCGRVDDIVCRALDAVRRELFETRAFTLDDHEITFYGRCARCRSEDQTVTSTP